MTNTSVDLRGSNPATVPSAVPTHRAVTPILDQAKQTVTVLLDLFLTALKATLLPGTWDTEVEMKHKHLSPYTYNS